VGVSLKAQVVFPGELQNGFVDWGLTIVLETSVDKRKAVRHIRNKVFFLIEFFKIIISHFGVNFDINRKWSQ
jgi:hypothetical protein